MAGSAEQQQQQPRVAPWCLIESDPFLFRTLITMFGAKDVSVDEVWDMEHRLCDQDCGPELYGLIFLFKWSPEFTRLRESMAVPWDSVPHVFFAKQVIPNACATQAILSVLLNSLAASPNLEIGDDLCNLRNFAMSFDPMMKGLTIAQSDNIRLAHNSFSASRSAFEFLNLQPRHSEDSDDDNFHFVAYVPIAGTVYELDGLLSGPLPAASYDISNPSSWMRAANETLKKRIASFAGNEIRFSLLAVQEDKSKYLNCKLDSLLSLAGAGDEAASMEAAQLRSEIEEEEARLVDCSADLDRRKHNYVPLLYALLKRLAHACPEFFSRHLPEKIY